MKFDEKHFKIGLYLLIAIVILTFVIKRIAKNQPPPAIKEPDDYTNPNLNLEELAKEMYNVIKGISLSNNKKSYEKLSLLSDKDLVRFLNIWDKLYFSKWKETFFEAFRKERFLTNISFYRNLYKRIENLEKMRGK